MCVNCYINNIIYKYASLTINVWICPTRDNRNNGHVIFYFQTNQNGQNYDGVKTITIKDSYRNLFGYMWFEIRTDGRSTAGIRQIYMTR